MDGSHTVTVSTVNTVTIAHAIADSVGDSVCLTRRFHGYLVSRAIQVCPLLQGLALEQQQLLYEKAASVELQDNELLQIYGQREVKFLWVVLKGRIRWQGGGGAAGEHRFSQGICVVGDVGMSYDGAPSTVSSMGQVHALRMSRQLLEDLFGDELKERLLKSRIVYMLWLLKPFRGLSLEALGPPFCLPSTMTWGADKAFLHRLAIRRWKARFPFWPPSDASPVTPIEPWGKQFFVYNAPPGVQLRGDARAPIQDDVRPSWVRDQDAASLMLDEEDISVLPDAPKKHTDVGRRAVAKAEEKATGTETVLCCTDFRQRPLLYLSAEEWEEFRRQIPALKEKLQSCQEEIDEQDEEGAAWRDYLLRRKYIVDKHAEKRVGKEGYGSNFRRSYETGKVGPRARERRTPVIARELERYSRGQVE